jgi:hypothetical protein
MDKSIETKRSVVSADIKPVERILKRYETLTSKDYSSRRSDAREQIIEEQIEEYKKKREKIFGDKSAMNFTSNDSRKETQEEETSIKTNPEKIEEETIILQEENGENGEKQDKKIDIDELQLEDKEDKEKINDDTEEDSKLSRLKLKSEETKRKKESLQKELDESYNEGNLEKLVRILGEDKNIQVINIKFINMHFFYKNSIFIEINLYKDVFCSVRNCSL